MSMHDPLVTLRQMVDFIEEAQAIARDRSLDSIMNDQVLLRAFERVMELVGEAAKRLPLSLREQYPQMPWCHIAGMRDVISHAYEDLTYGILWDALQLHFPELLTTVNLMITDLEKKCPIISVSSAVRSERVQTKPLHLTVL